MAIISLSALPSNHSLKYENLVTQNQSYKYMLIYTKNPVCFLRILKRENPSKLRCMLISTKSIKTTPMLQYFIGKKKSLVILGAHITICILFLKSSSSLTVGETLQPLANFCNHFRNFVREETNQNKST